MNDVFEFTNTTATLRVKRLTDTWFNLEIVFANGHTETAYEIYETGRANIISVKACPYPRTVKQFRFDDTNKDAAWESAIMFAINEAMTRYGVKEYRRLKCNSGN